MNIRHISTLALCATALCLSTLGVGPKFPALLTFTPSPSAGVTGYWLYVRTSSGTYSDSLRWPMSTNAYSGFDLRTLGMQKGQYYVSASATNATSESDLSVEVLWDYTNPNKPTNLQIQ